MDASMMARLKAREEENRRLKKMCPEARLKAEIVQEALQKKWQGHLSSERWPGKRHSNALSVFDWPALRWVSVKPVTGISRA